MICYVCDADNWNQMPEMNPERILQVCKGCGNVAYRVEPDAEEKMKQYYRHEYRPAPNVSNLITSNHKQFYIRLFLGEFMKGKKGLVCGDVGSAIGYIPAMLRKLGHRATGCELTVLYRRFSENFYGVPLTEELDDRHQYDLITIYHVLEHMIEPDKKLIKYVSMLKDDGHIMVSTPEWFNTLEEASGSIMSSFEHLFHKDHINVFSATSIKNLFRKAGLVIAKEDHITYGQTYLLRKAAPNIGETKIELGPVQVEPWEGQVEKIRRAKQAIALILEKKYVEAYELWPKFPEAYMNLIYDTYHKDPAHQEKTFKQALTLLPENARLRLAHAHWLFMRENFKLAYEEFGWLINHKPSEDVMMYLSWCCAHLGKPQEAIGWALQSCDANPQKWIEAMNWVCQQSVQMPTWDERATQEIKEKLFQGAAPRIVPNDPIMNPSQPAVSEAPLK